MKNKCFSLQITTHQHSKYLNVYFIQEYRGMHIAYHIKPTFIFKHLVSSNNILSQKCQIILNIQVKVHVFFPIIIHPGKRVMFSEACWVKVKKEISGKKIQYAQRIRTIPATPKAIVVHLYHSPSKTVHLLLLCEICNQNRKTLIGIFNLDGCTVGSLSAYSNWPLKDLRKWTVVACGQLILFFWHYIPTSPPPPQWRQQRVLQRPRHSCSCVEIHCHLRLKNERATELHRK